VARHRTVKSGVDLGFKGDRVVDHLVARVPHLLSVTFCVSCPFHVYKVGLESTVEMSHEDSGANHAYFFLSGANHNLSSLSMAITLNCAVHGDQEAFDHIFKVDLSPDTTVAKVRQNVFPLIAWKYGIAADLVLYTPRTPISTASKENFIEAFSRLPLKELTKLNPTFSVSKSGLSHPGAEQLHIVVVISAGE
jgi:hypothetical protein